MNILDIKDLYFSYNEKSKYYTLNNINTYVNKGDFVVLCGNTGSGKTTLLKMMKKEIIPCGLKSGQILYNGIDILQLDDKTSVTEIGYVMQNPDMQIVTDKVSHELAFGLENIGLKPHEIHCRIAETVSSFGLENIYNMNTNKISGGQKQKINLASILVMQPKLILLDEPCANLDPISTSEFIHFLIRLNRESGITIIMAEHKLESVFAVANRIWFMDKGKLILDNSPQEIASILNKHYKHNPILNSLPCATKIFYSINSDTTLPCPITIKDGIQFISENCNNKIKKSISETKKTRNENTILEIKNLKFKYDNNKDFILKNINLKIYCGEFLTIHGPNGAGKTTLLKNIAGILHSFSGKIKSKDKNLKIQYLPQNPRSLFLKSSVFEDLKLACTSFEKDKFDIERVVSILQIQHILNTHPYDLSGGELQLAAIAKILLTNPKILLLDEPVKGLDSNSKKIFAHAIQSLKNLNIAIISVSHDLEFSAMYSDKCAMLFNGEIIYMSNKREFFSSNYFYTTAASKISRHIYDNAITTDEVIELCKINTTSFKQ